MSPTSVVGSPGEISDRSPSFTPSSPVSRRSRFALMSGARVAEAGQATAEYALVVLAAAAVGGLALAWAASTGRIARLLDAVINSVMGQVG